MIGRPCAYILPRQMEACLRRDELSEVLGLEFQIAEEGDPRELAWLFLAYEQLDVPHDTRRTSRGRPGRLDPGRVRRSGAQAS
jgi:hypothetical protein